MGFEQLLSEIDLFCKMSDKLKKHLKVNGIGVD